MSHWAVLPDARDGNDWNRLGFGDE
jgi:hypothetical protein